MEDGLVHLHHILQQCSSLWGLNPCCDGRWSRTNGAFRVQLRIAYGLNPCCDGRWSRTARFSTFDFTISES